MEFQWQYIMPSSRRSMELYFITPKKLPRVEHCWHFPCALSLTTFLETFSIDNQTDIVE